MEDIIIMSDYYKSIRKKILEDYKMFGWEEKSSYYGSLFVMIVCIIYIILAVDKQNSANIPIILTMIIISGVCYFYSKRCKKNHEKMKLKAIEKMLDSPDTNIEIINELINELEKYINKTRIFATWATGVFLTLLVLIIGGVFNLLVKFFDIFIKELPEKEVSTFLTDISGITQQDVMLRICDLLASLGLVIYLFYLVSLIFTFNKKQILLFVYDVRYEMLKNTKQETDSNKNII